MTDRRDIGSRLENWARVYRDTYRAGISPTGAYCDQLRREAEGEKPAPERRKVDEADAERIERGMRELPTEHRLLLFWCYIKQAQPEIICRKLSIARKPATVFITRIRDAQRAIESVAGTDERYHDE